MNLNATQTILIVEDSDDDFFATERAFKKSGLRNPVKRCVTGDQALDYLYIAASFLAWRQCAAPASSCSISTCQGLMAEKYCMSSSQIR